MFRNKLFRTNAIEPYSPPLPPLGSLQKARLPFPYLKGAGRVSGRFLMPCAPTKKAELSTNGVPGAMTEDFKLLVVELGFICKPITLCGIVNPNAPHT